MRFVVVILIATALLGAVAWSQFALTRTVSVDITREAHVHGAHDPVAQGARFRIELTTTFAAGTDPFAVQLESSASPRLILRGPEGVLLAHTSDIARGETITVEDVPLAGEAADLFVKAVPSPAEAARPCAVRLRILREGVVCDDITVWSEGGGTVTGTVRVRLEPRLESVDRGLGAARD